MSAVGKIYRPGNTLTRITRSGLNKEVCSKIKLYTLMFIGTLGATFKYILLQNNVNYWNRLFASFMCKPIT